MHRYLKARFLASALAVATLPLALAPTAAQAEVHISIGFNYFHDNLSNYGDWVYSDRWGRVWRPDVDADFRPYSNGHWAYTRDYGWYWVSREPFADITYHYGRWINDPYDGWLWIPGYVWSPAWVVWRSNGSMTGWMPMPPTEAFLNGDENSYDISDNDDYGYRNWYPDYNDRNYASLWVFVGTRHIGDRDYHRYAVGRPQFDNVFRQTRNVTNYRIENNHVVNRSIDMRAVQRAGGRVDVQRASALITRPQLVTQVDAGRQIQLRMRKDAPHGTGRPNSAPPPTQQQIQTLSPTIKTRGDRPTNLMTRTTVEKLQRTEQPGAQKPQMPANAPRQETATPPAGAPAANPREERQRLRDRGTPAATPSPAVQPNAQKIQPPVNAPPADNMRENRGRGREQGAPVNAAPAATPSPEGNVNRMRGRNEKAPETPKAVTPNPAAPPAMERQMPAAAPVAPDQPSKRPERDQRQELRNRAREQAPQPPAEVVRPQPVPTPPAPAEVHPPREQAAPPATSGPRPMQRMERPAKEDRTDRGDKKDKKDDKQKDENPPQ